MLNVNDYYDDDDDDGDDCFDYGCDDVDNDAVIHLV